ncbi:MAG: hypothetical protein U0807_09305 [Candidatus Binatia bacterium]
MTLTDKAQRRSQGTWQIIVAVLFVGILAARSAIAAPGDLIPHSVLEVPLHSPSPPVAEAQLTFVAAATGRKDRGRRHFFDGSHLRFSWPD